MLNADRKNNQRTSEAVGGLLGQSAQPEVLGMFGAPPGVQQPSPEQAFNQRFTTQLKPARKAQDSWF